MSITPAFCLTTEEKARKNLSQGSENLSQGSSGFSSLVFYMGLVVEEMTLGQVSLLVLRYFNISFHSASAPYSLLCHLLKMKF